MIVQKFEWNHCQVETISPYVTQCISYHNEGTYWNHTLYCGSISDTEIVEKSRFYTHLHKGNVLMADKGFLIHDQLAKVGAHFAMPNFVKDKGKFSLQEWEQNKTIAIVKFP